MDADGTKTGYDIEMIKAARKEVRVPIIASGGAGKLEDFSAALDAGADALLAASIFHFGAFKIAEVKGFLSRAGYPVRE